MTQALEQLTDQVEQITHDRIEAVVAVEQARAVAQVAAAVKVAQQFPRDLARVRAELAEACASHDLAAVAFYALPNRGQGMTVHVLAELAVLWGNVDAGVHELRRDDAAGMSEIQAFAWDVQRNSRHTRTFQVPHMIDTSERVRGVKIKRRQVIEDLIDVYRNNMSVGARAYRECVARILPRWMLEEAERRLRETLRRGPGVPIEDRRAEAARWAARNGLTREQVEARVGRPYAQWSEEDVSRLEVVAASIDRGETTVAEQFDAGPARVSADELTVPEQPAPEPVGDQRPATRQQITKVILMLNDLDVEGDDAQHAWLTRELGREVTTRNSLTRAEASTVIDVLGVLIDERDAQSGGDA